MSYYFIIALPLILILALFIIFRNFQLNEIAAMRLRLRRMSKKMDQVLRIADVTNLDFTSSVRIQKSFSLLRLTERLEAKIDRLLNHLKQIKNESTSTLSS